MVITPDESRDVKPLSAEDYIERLAHVTEDVLHAMLAHTLEACANADLAEWEDYQRQAAMLEAIGNYRFPGFADWHNPNRRH